MIQREYLFHTFDDLTRIVKEINASDEYKNAAGVLLQLNNPKVDSDDERIVDYINMGLEKARLIGMTAANVSDEESHRGARSGFCHGDKAQEMVLKH